MIETENRRVSGTRENRDEWLADLAGMASNRDVYAERRQINAYGASGAVQPREAGMTDRYDKAGYGSRDDHYGTSLKHAPVPQGDDYYDHDDTTAAKRTADAYDDEQGEPEPEWTYDEARGQWVDRYGNPYVEAYAEGEEDRYAPADDEYLAPQADSRRLQPRKSRGGAVSLAALVLVASIGGGLAYAWKKGGFIGSDLPGIGSAPPVIKANTDPVKIKPAETVASNDQPTREIFDRSSPATATGNERLVRHEEQPMAVVPVRPEGGTAATVTNAPDASRPVTTSNITLPPSDAASGQDQTAAADGPVDLSAGSAPEASRRVKTVKVMPDHSIVTGEAPISADPPAATDPNAGYVASLTTGSGQVSSTTTTRPVTVTPSSADDDTTAAAQPPIAPVATAPATGAPPVADTPISPSVSDDANATTTVEPAPHAEATPPAIPPVRPRNIPTQTQQVAAAEPAAAASTAASNGAYVVQVSSQKSPADAQAAFQSLQRKYASVLGSMKPSIRKVDLPDRGTYYRVRVGSWGSSAEAGAFCAKLKAAGGDCVIARN
jgi:hypothetical protein